jgi:hypothetical protein
MWFLLMGEIADLLVITHGLAKLDSYFEFGCGRDIRPVVVNVRNRWIHDLEVFSTNRGTPKKLTVLPTLSR